MIGSKQSQCKLILAHFALVIRMVNILFVFSRINFFSQIF